MLRHGIAGGWSVTLFFCFVLCLLGPTVAWSQPGTPSDQVAVRRMAFGSCANQQKPCPIWRTMADYQPEVLLLLGDNVYADLLSGRLNPATPERIEAAYVELNQEPNFKRLRQSTVLMATWDDHDYGTNDGGREWIHKVESQRLFHDFLGTPADSPNRQRPGVYNARIIGPPNQRVQIIMLDTRYFRSELPQSDRPLPGWRSRPYIKQTGPDAELLGEAQWEWLAEQLRQPAEIRIIGSSIQVISDEHPFEMWGNFPDERQRFYDLVKQCQASGVIVVSGDRHLGEISLDTNAVGYPLFDLTASGLNQAFQGWRLPEPNSKRFAALPFGDHFGTIEIDWETKDPQIALQLRLENGEIAVQTQVPLSRLQAAEAELPVSAGVLSAKDALLQEVGEEVTVQIKVRGGRELTRPSRVLLNSETDYQAEHNFTFVVESSALVGKYSGANFATFRNQTVQGTGKITLYNDRKQLTIERPDDLEIVGQ